MRRCGKLPAIFGLFLALGSGCAQIRLPAIDPSGERIFLPPPASTVIDPGFTFGATPAFPSPPPLPPPGSYGPLVPYNDMDLGGNYGPWGLSTSVLPGTYPVTGSAVAPAPSGAPAPSPVPSFTAGVPYMYGASDLTDGYRAKLTITPKRVVAPVGREVVIIAGLCGEDGYLLRDQLIEWSLAPDSVGTIIEVDQVDKPLWRHLLRKAPRKISGQYALGLTSACANTLPRGTADPSDDIQILEGQTWITVSSNTEGASQITAVGPTAAGWEDRRDTATIYWVDGQWELPPPITAGSAGGILKTRILRATSGQPLPGWRVRYEILGGTPAALDANGAQTLEVETNSDGIAAATVLPLGGYVGTTQINVQVIRVGTSAGDLPRLTVGQGTTSVTWIDDGSVPPTVTSPSDIPPTPGGVAGQPRLTVDVQGPEVAEVNSIVTYQITVTNVGTVPLSNVEVVNEPPPGLQFLRGAPTGGEFGNGIRWQLESIEPGDRRAIIADYRVVQGGLLRNCARATSGGVSAENCATTDVRTTNLAVELRGPAQAAVGESIRFEILVTNLSDIPVEGLVLSDEFDAGLEHSAGPSPVEWSVGNLGPRESRTFPIRFTARAAGRQCHSLTVRTRSGAQANDSICVEVVERPGAIVPPPTGGSAVRIQWRGPNSSSIGQREECYVNVMNMGSVPLGNLQLELFLDPELVPRETNPALPSTATRLSWPIPNLGASMQATVGIIVQPMQASQRACLRAQVSSVSGVLAEEALCFPIRGEQYVPPSPGPGIPSGPPDPFNSATSNQELQVRVTRLAASWEGAAGDIPYTVDITNRGGRNHNGVVLQIQVPEGTQFVTAAGPPGAEVLEVSGDRSTVSFRPILTLRAGETVNFQIRVRQVGPVVGRLRAAVNSEEDRTPVTGEG